MRKIAGIVFMALLATSCSTGSSGAPVVTAEPVTTGSTAAHGMGSGATMSDSDSDMPGMDMGAQHPAAEPAVTPAATPTGAVPDMPPGGVTRTYYISADKVKWNYAPLGHNGITGKPFDAVANVFVKKGPDRIGSTYTKCLYRGYTDATFATREKRPADEAYLGLLGPTIHAEVGDTIKVVFRNTCPFPASVHPHGVFYDKSSEGAPYADGTKQKADDAVATGKTYTYTWYVPERAGPGPMDGSSVLWMYHSHTDEIKDVYSGLVGAMIVTGKGLARPDGTPADVDHEVITMFAVMNENNTHFIDTEAKALPGDIDEGDEEFNESNLMHSINGYVYGNGPVPVIKAGEKTRWYTLDVGTEVDLHTPHWHGNTVLVNGMRTDMESLLPGMMMTADMVADNIGIWLFHCHVNDHIAAGMQMRYQVVA